MKLFSKGYQFPLGLDGRGEKTPTAKRRNAVKTPSTIHPGVESNGEGS